MHHLCGPAWSSRGPAKQRQDGPQTTKTQGDKESWGGESKGASQEMSETRRIGTWDRHDGWTRADHPSSQIPRLKCGWLRLWFRFTGGRHCLLDGEGHGLLSPIRRPSLPNRRVALRGPAPRAKPAGAPPHPRGFLPRTKSGVGGNPNPLAGEDRLPRKLPSMSLSEPLQYPIAGFGSIYHHGCPKQFQLALEGFAFRSEAEEGACQTQPWFGAGRTVHFG